MASRTKQPSNKPALVEAETRLSDAILRLTKVAESGPPAILHELTTAARNVASADCAMFFAVSEETSGLIQPSAATVVGILPSEYERMLARLFAPAINAGAPTHPVDPSAEPDPLSLLVFPVVLPNGTFLGHLVICKAGSHQFSPSHERSIAAVIAHARLALDRARLAAAESGTRRSLRRALAIRDNFLSIASHELRNPLNSLHLRLDILKREAGLLGAESNGERLRGHAERASLQISRMARLLDRLLDISRIASGRIQLEPRRYDIASQLRQVAERFTDQTAPSQIHVATDDSVIGYWDEFRTDQVLTNLLSNAIKYGEGKPIRLALRAGEDFVEITIADQGIGIAAEDQDRVFARFERVEGERSRSGFGLGLWISQQIVTAMGGTIRVQSEPGHGATFTVRLPRHTLPPTKIVRETRSAGASLLSGLLY